MAGKLRSAVLKFERAVKQRETLKEECRAFIDTKPYSISNKLKVERGWLIVTFWVRRRPPMELSLIAGDVIGNVNAALDHLVYGLSRTKPDWTGFPVAIDPDDYVRNHRERLLAGVRNWPDRAIIDAYQPYEGAMKADPLYLMRHFANADKHRVTRPAYARPRHYRVKTPPQHPVVVVPTKFVGPLKHRAEILRFRFNPPTPISVQVQTEIDISIGFGDMSVDLVDIDAILARAAEVIDAF